MVKVTKEDLLKNGFNSKLLTSIAVIELDSGRVKLKKRFVPEEGKVKSKAYGPEWDMSKLWLSARCHNRGDFWKLFREFVREGVKDPMEEIMTFEEAIDILPTPIYALSERELKKFLNDIIGGNYTIIFHATLADRINEALDIMRKDHPVKMAAVESCEIAPCCDNVRYKEKLYNISFGLELKETGVDCEFYIFNDAKRHGILTMKTQYAGIAGCQLLGELGGILAALLSNPKI